MLAFNLWGLEISGWWALGVIATIGTAIGLIIAYFASREYIRQTIKVLKDTIASQADNLKAKDELALALDQTHKQNVASLEAKLKTMTDERDAYRGDLHALRNKMGPLELELQQLKLRPDLNQVLEKEEAWHARREEFYTAMASNQRSIIETQRLTLEVIHQIKTSVDDELKQSNEVCSQVGKALQDIVMKMEEREEAAAERDRGMTSILTEILKQLKNGQPQTTPAT